MTATDHHTPMRIVIGLDPGPEKSAVVVWDGSAVYQSMIYHLGNESILDWLKGPNRTWPLVIEKVASFGMPVGAEVFETVYWSGRFAEAYGAKNVHRLTRIQIKNHLCHSSRAKDGNIRQAIIDRCGGKDNALGRKASPGVLYGVSGDGWSALAVAMTFWDLANEKEAGRG